MNGVSTTLILIGLTVLVSWTAFNNRKLLDALILWPPAIRRNNEHYRLMTYGLVHADFAHLLFNMWWLKDLGTMIERRQAAWYLALLVVVIAAHRLHPAGPRVTDIATPAE